MNIIIIGCGKVGLALAEQLSKENHNITVVDKDDRLVKSATESYDIIGVAGDGQTVATLREAGVSSAWTVIAVTDSDEVNLISCLLAKKLGAHHTIARVRRTEYSEELRLIKEDLGLSMAVSPERETANEAARLLKFPSAISIDTFARGRIELLSCNVKEGMPICGAALKDIPSRIKSKVLIGYIERNNDVFIPSGNDVLQSGDTIGIVANSRNAAGFFEEIGLVSGRIRRVMIIGGSRLGYFLARQLLDLKMHVTVIEINEKKAEEISEMLPGAVVICGDGSDRDILMAEGIDKMDALCCFTGIDEENIMLSMAAKTMVPGLKTITKVTRGNFDDILQELDIGSIVNPKEITSGMISQYVRTRINSLGNNVETLYHIAGGRAEALEFNVREGCAAASIPLAQLNIRKGVLVCNINRAGQVIIPGGGDCMMVGDTVVIITTLEGLDDLNDILEQKE